MPAPFNQVRAMEVMEKCAPVPHSHRPYGHSSASMCWRQYPDRCQARLPTLATAINAPISGIRCCYRHHALQRLIHHTEGTKDAQSYRPGMRPCRLTKTARRGSRKRPLTRRDSAIRNACRRCPVMAFPTISASFLVAVKVRAPPIRVSRTECPSRFRPPDGSCRCGSGRSACEQCDDRRYSRAVSPSASSGSPRSARMTACAGVRELVRLVKDHGFGALACILALQHDPRQRSPILSALCKMRGARYSGAHLRQHELRQ